MKLFNEKGEELDFYHELTKYAGYLRKSYFSRHMAIYELYKRTIELPGSVAEFGIYNGSTYFFLSRLIEIFNPSMHEIHHSSSCHIFGFDNFEGFVEISDKDNDRYFKLQKFRGGLRGNRDSFFEVLNNFKKESAISKRMHVIEGDIQETFGPFLKKYSWVKLRFCLMDLDLYKPTKVVLDKLFDIMVPGGIIVFDEYGLPEWQGETIAVDEFIKRHNLVLHSIPWTFAPSAYCTIT